MAGTLTPTQSEARARARLMSQARKMKILYRKPRVSEATKRKRAKDRVAKKCGSDATELFHRLKSAVPSARKISQLDYFDFVDLKKHINKLLSKIRSHAKRCNKAFVLPRTAKYN